MFFKRLGYYLFGFSVGLICLLFFFNKKNTRCHYLPDSRVKNDLLKKEIRFQETILPTYRDSVSIVKFILNSRVNFSKSKTKLDSCKIYLLEDKKHKDFKQIQLKNCKRHIYIIEVK